MDFPSQGLVDCLISLAIHEGEVEYLAMTLFNTKVESMGHIRSIILPGGVRLTLFPEVKLSGVKDKAIIRVFGPVIYEAVLLSRGRKEELERGIHLTEGLSMILISSSSKRAIINLSLLVKGGFKIHEKLYT
jgi:hypothetical protein